MAQILTAQPFPFIHFDIDVGDFVPCGITTGRYVQGTQTEMMRLYWKVKKYSVSGSFTNYAFNNPAYPQSTSYSGTVESSAATELNLVCGAGTTSNITTSGSINSAFLDLQWKGSDFYYNSTPTQPIVKLYGDITFNTDQDDTSGITTSVGGSLSAFTIDGFQVYQGESQVNYDATSFLGIPLINNFSASVVATDFWPYEA